MKTPTIEPQNEPPREMPELHNTVLGEPQLHQLIDDIETCTEVVEILPKYAAQARAPVAAAITLPQARELLTRRALRGLQIRYRYDGADWWDTIMVMGNEFRVVRIRHDFSSV